MASLRQILLMQRDVPSAARFYAEGLGLRVRNLSPTCAELETGGTRITLRAGAGEAVLSTGYSPLLAFDVPDLDTAVQKLLGLGARLDGPIRYPVHGKVASMRGPDGHMLGLYERASSALPTDADAVTSEGATASAAAPAAETIKGDGGRGRRGGAG